MEIPVINRLGDNFEAGISSLQNPSFVSQALAFSGVEKTFLRQQASDFWKWGALILALLASFTTIINSIRFLLVQFRNHPLVSTRQSQLNKQENYDCDTDTDGSSSCSSSSSEGEDENEEEDEASASVSAPESSSSHGWRSVLDEDFSVKGSDQWQNRELLRRRRSASIGDLFSWSEFRSGKSVVKLWDNLGLGLAVNFAACDDSRNVAVYDMNKEKTLFSILGARFDAVPAAVSSSRSVIVSAEETNVSGNLLRVWDTRVGCRIPALLAEWSPRLGKIVGVNAGGIEKVYVRDDVIGGGGLTVGDMRKVGSPLVNVTGSDVDLWWDADAVILMDETR